MSDLQELFARLKAQAHQAPASDSHQGTTQQGSIWANPQQPSVSSPIFSPPTQTP
ncbi:hypothetical protein KC352_g32140, partial [Hortaea werneckii]